MPACVSGTPINAMLAAEAATQSGRNKSRNKPRQWTMVVHPADTGDCIARPAQRQIGQRRAADCRIDSGAANSSTPASSTTSTGPDSAAARRWNRMTAPLPWLVEQLTTQSVMPCKRLVSMRRQAANAAPEKHGQLEHDVRSGIRTVRHHRSFAQRVVLRLDRAPVLAARALPVVRARTRSRSGRNGTPASAPATGR